MVLGSSRNACCGAPRPCGLLTRVGTIADHDRDVAVEHLPWSTAELRAWLITRSIFHARVADVPDEANGDASAACAEPVRTDHLAAAIEPSVDALFWQVAAGEDPEVRPLYQEAIGRVRAVLRGG